MDTKWLEDFVSLAETQSFSRSAELRHVTQPAFSRRIQSLEAWLGADLIDRTSYPTRLTSAGEVFYAQAIEMLGQISNARSLLRSKPNKQLAVIDFAVPHTLSLTYLPKWLTQLEKSFGQVNSRLLALNVHDAVMTLVEGGCDLMLCYHHPHQPVQLDQSQYEMMIMGVETLRAYARSNAQGAPHFVLPGTKAQPLPFLSYTNNAYLDRMVDVILANTSTPVYLDKRYETDMAEGLKMMALEGHGIAFLPESSVTRELKRKQLARADNGVAHWEVEMQIRLYRQRPSEQRPGKPLVNRLWEFLLQQSSLKKRR
jgi:DNA-binding transcriptional LysR family regulator